MPSRIARTGRQLANSNAVGVGDEDGTRRVDSRERKLLVAARAGALRTINRVDTVLTTAEKVCAAIAGICLALIALAVTAAAVSRYLANYPLGGVDVYVENYLAPAVAFFALAPTARVHRHIGVTVLVDRLSRKQRQVVLSLGSLCVAALFGLIAYEGAIRVVDSIASNESAEIGIVIPPWVGYLSVPIGSALLALRMAWWPLIWLSRPYEPVALAQVSAEETVAEVEARPEAGTGGN